MERFFICSALDADDGTPAPIALGTVGTWDDAIQALRDEAREPRHTAECRTIYRERDGVRELVLRADHGITPGQWTDTFTWDGHRMHISGYGGHPPYSIVVE